MSEKEEGSRTDSFIYPKTVMCGSEQGIRSGEEGMSGELGLGDLEHIGV